VQVVRQHNLGLLPGGRVPHPLLPLERPLVQRLGRVLGPLLFEPPLLLELLEELLRREMNEQVGVVLALERERPAVNLIR
jgi:hypothetical protein